MFEHFFYSFWYFCFFRESKERMCVLDKCWAYTIVFQLQNTHTQTHTHTHTHHTPSLPFLFFCLNTLSIPPSFFNLHTQTHFLFFLTLTLTSSTSYLFCAKSASNNLYLPSSLSSSISQCLSTTVNNWNPNSSSFGHYGVIRFVNSSVFGHLDPFI